MVYSGNDVKEDPMYLSPLSLLYSAYTDERPIFSPSMETSLDQIDRRLSSLPQKERNEILGIVHSLYQENEKLAFHAGIQTGVRLMEELAEI